MNLVGTASLWCDSNWARELVRETVVRETGIMHGTAALDKMAKSLMGGVWVALNFAILVPQLLNYSQNVQAA